MIFVTGYFGAPIREEAQRIASGKGRTVLDLDRMIEEKDGRSIARLCMMGGEHAYRNAEYEAVQELLGMDPQKLTGYSLQAELPDQEDPLPEPVQTESVVACGDGILYDEDTRKLILQQELVIAGEDMSMDELWARARQEESTYHAFMKFGTGEERRSAFEAHHQRQKALFDSVIADRR